MQINFNRFVFSCIAGMLLVLTGCSMASDVEATIKRDVETAIAGTETARLPRPPRVMDTISIHDDIWLGDSSSKMEQGASLPAKYETEDGITLVGGRGVTLMEIAEQVTSLTGIPVRMEDVLLKELQTGTGPTDENDGANLGMGGSSGTTVDSIVMLLAYSGPLSGLLDLVSSRFSIWWHYIDGVISFYQMETRVFTIYALAGQGSFSGNVGGSATSGSSETSGSASNTMTNSGEVDVWKEVDDGIRSIVKDGFYSISKSNGTVTITCAPFTMKKVADFIRTQNEILARQVAVGVKILQVTISDSDKYGLDLTAVMSVGDGAGITETLRGPFQRTSATSSGLAMAIVNATATPINKWNGTEMIIEALSEQGAVSLVTSSAVTTLNNKPVPVQVANQQTYIAEISSTTTDSGVEISASPETITSGINMQLLPKILKHGKLMMRVSLTITDLIKIETVNIGDGIIQLPELSTRGFIQEISMNSGSTLVLTGFERVENRVDKNGIGSPDFTLWGGKNDSSKNRSVLVVLLTPEVLISPIGKYEIS